MSSEEQTAVEATNITTNTAEITTTEKQQTEISESTVPAKQLQQTTSDVSKATINNINNNNSANSKSKIKFVVGTEESRENNYLTSENIIDSKGRVEGHTDTKSCSNPKEEVSKVAGEKIIAQQSQKQNIEGNKEAVKEHINNTNNNTNTKEIPAEPQLPLQKIQQQTPKEQKVHETNSSEPSKLMTMTSMETHQAAPVVTNTTVTVPTQRQITSAPFVKQQKKFILRDSPDSSPISSPSDGIHNASYINPNNSGQSSIQPNHNLDSYNMYPSTPDDSTTSDPLSYPQQPRFPPSNGISRTQQKLLLQRQHFLADDENYLIHPRNQLRLTKVIERINREHAAILLYRDPIIESLQRVWPKYVQDHPEVLGDDFGVGYEDSKDWGVISDHGKSEDHIRPNSIISTETLGIDSMPLRGIK